MLKKLLCIMICLCLVACTFVGCNNKTYDDNLTFEENVPSIPNNNNGNGDSTTNSQEKQGQEWTPVYPQE